MKRYLWLVLLPLFLLACADEAPPPQVVPPTAVPISDDSGETVAMQEGPIWVLLSGVDEHGLVAEGMLGLLENPDPDIEANRMVQTGIAASVLEIRQSGPQSLQRFFRVETVDGATGWISDYYVRRVAYLYDANSDGVDLYASPDGELLSRLVNVSPVSVIEPMAGGVVAGGICCRRDAGLGEGIVY